MTDDRAYRLEALKLGVEIVKLGHWESAARRTGGAIEAAKAFEQFLFMGDPPSESEPVSAVKAA